MGRMKSIEIVSLRFTARLLNSRQVSFQNGSRCRKLIIGGEGKRKTRWQMVNMMRLTSDNR
jgi:hypothetical protein